MESKKNLEQSVMMAAQQQGISSVLFRNAIGRKLGLNSAESDCLSYVSITGTAAPTAIARYIGLTTGSTTTMLDRLEKAGYIVRQPNPNDRRGVLIALTPKWQKDAGPLVGGLVKAHAELISDYTEAELKTIADFLTRFTANVDSHTKTIDKL